MGNDKRRARDIMKKIIIVLILILLSSLINAEIKNQDNFNLSLIHI